MIGYRPGTPREFRYSELRMVDGAGLSEYAKHIDGWLAEDPTLGYRAMLTRLGAQHGVSATKSTMRRYLKSHHAAPGPAAPAGRTPHGGEAFLDAGLLRLGGP